MEKQNNRFPQQEESAKIHGTTDNTEQKEKYLRDSGKIEDYPDQEEVAKMSSEPKKDAGESEDVTERGSE